MEKQLRAYLLKVARVYADATGYAEATVSRRMHGTDKFLKEFAQGKRTITLAVLQRTFDNFKEAWPKGLLFPAPPRLSTPGPRLRRKSSPTSPI